MKNDPVVAARTFFPNQGDLSRRGLLDGVEYRISSAAGHLLFVAAILGIGALIF